MSETVTTAVAILGAVTGVGSLAVQVVRARQERPMLRFEVNVRDMLGRPPRVVIDIFNDSPLATTVREVGLYGRPTRVNLRRATGETTAGYAEVDFPFTDRPFFMEANEMRQFAGFPDIFASGIHIDAPLRAYAIDGRNRRIWAPSAAAYCRLMLGDSLPVQDDDSDGLKRLVTADGVARSPWPVEPGWKLWKPRDTRRWSSEARAVRRQQQSNGTLRIRGFVRLFDPDE